MNDLNAMKALGPGAAPRLVVGIVLTALVSLSVHVAMLQGFHVPYPGTPADAPWAQYVSRGWLHALGLIWLNALLGPSFGRRRFVVRTAVLFLLAAMLTEALFRLPFMQGFCSDSIPYAFARALPHLFAALTLAALVVAIAPWAATVPRKIAAAAVLGAVSLHLLNPAFAKLFEQPLAALAHLARPAWCELPYGWNVEFAAYLSFAEPVLAAFGIAALAWDGLPSTLWKRLFAFTVLVMMLRRQLIAAPIYMAWSDFPAWTGLAAMGQFSLEALTLGLLTASCWHWVQRRADA